MSDIIIIPPILILAFVGFRRPVVGMLTFVFLGVFSPHSYTWGFGRTVPLSLIVAFTTISGMFLSSESKKLPAQREMVLLILLWLTFALSSTFALFPERAFPKLIEISKILLMIVIATMLINSKEHLHSLIKVIAYSLGFYALKGGIAGIVSGGGTTVYGPQLSFLFANNSIGLAMAINIPLLYYLYRMESKYWLRRVLQAMMLFSLPAILFTYSRGAWLGMATAIALLALRVKHKILVVGTLGIMAALSSTIASHIAPDRLVNRYDQLVHYQEDTSAESRLWSWEFCRRVGMARPTGGGYGFSARTTYERYYPEFMERWNAKWTCHSIWLAMLGEHGILGITLWVALIASTLISLRRLRSMGRTDPENSWLVPFSECVQIALIVYLVVGTFLDAEYFDLFYYLIAFVVIAKGVVEAVPARAAETSSASMAAARIAAGSGLRSRSVT